MCEEHSVIAVLRREEFPKYLNRKKEKEQFVFPPNYCLDQLNSAWLFTEIWAAQVRGTSDTNPLARQLRPPRTKLLVSVDPTKPTCLHCKSGPVSVLCFLTSNPELALASISQSEGHHFKQSQETRIALHTGKQHLIRNVAACRENLGENCQWKGKKKFVKTLEKVWLLLKLGVALHWELF